MALAGEEIRRKLAEFAVHWGGYQGSERAEAQTFLNELLRCYGSDRQKVGATFEEHGPGGFMDMIWPGVCIVAAKAVIERRSEICLDRQIGLTKLYNEVDDGAYKDLRKLHDQLDEAVAAAYGWAKKAAHDPAESNRRLLELNQAIAANKVEYRPFEPSPSESPRARAPARAGSPEVPAPARRG